jgi:hypothetical protein
MARPGSSDLDSEDLPGMGDDEIADPLGQRRPTLRNRENPTYRAYVEHLLSRLRCLTEYEG